MPTFLSDHDWSVIHLITSAPSLASTGWKKSHTPPEQPVPRRLTPMKAYPWGTYWAT